MSRTRQAAHSEVRQTVTTAQVGRQLRAAFEPVPTGSGDFSDLLAQLDRAESSARRIAAE